MKHARAPPSTKAAHRDEREVVAGRVEQAVLRGRQGLAPNISLTQFHPTVKRVMRDKQGVVLEFHHRLGWASKDLGPVTDLELRCILLDLAARWMRNEDDGETRVRALYNWRRTRRRRRVAGLRKEKPTARWAVVAAEWVDNHNMQTSFADITRTHPTVFGVWREGDGTYTVAIKAEAKRRGDAGWRHQHGWHGRSRSQTQEHS